RAIAGVTATTPDRNRPAMRSSTAKQIDNGLPTGGEPLLNQNIPWVILVRIKNNLVTESLQDQCNRQELGIVHVNEVWPQVQHGTKRTPRLEEDAPYSCAGLPQTMYLNAIGRKISFRGDDEVHFVTGPCQARTHLLKDSYITFI